MPLVTLESPFVVAYDDLEAKGLPVPAKAAEEITYAEFAAHMDSVIISLIKKELDEDPAKLGYALKGDNVVAEMLNVAVADSGMPPRINTIFIGVPYAPNAVTAADVKAAKE